MTPEGWYNDPLGEAGYRWWDGSQWTEHTLPPDGPQRDETGQTPAPVAVVAEPAPQSDASDATTAEARTLPPSASTIGATSVAPTGTVTWPFDHEPAWCRACGTPAPQQTGACGTCSWALDASLPTVGLVGLVFETKNKLGITRLGLCIAEDDTNVQVHLSAKLTLEVPKDTATVRHLIPNELSAAGRIYRALALKRDGSIKAKWDEEYLTELAWSVGCSTTGGMRILADEAIANDWQFILDALPMSPSELAWRVAHGAASTGDIAALYDRLNQLPSDGYPTRCGLVLPHIGMVLTSPDRAGWTTLLRSWTQPGAASLCAIVDPSTDDLDVLVAAHADFARYLPADDRQRWDEAVTSLEAGTFPPAPYADAPQWEAVRHVQGNDAGQPLRLDLLPLTLIDDVIDGGRLPANADRSRLSEHDRHYITCRTDPGSLGHEQLRLVGHHAELGRRFYLERDASALHAMADDPAVDHYRGLLEFVDGADSLDRVRPATADALRLVESARQAIVAGETTLVPDEVAADPSTWVTFSELAFAGKVASDFNQRASHPAFGNWLDIHRVINLLWAGEWAEAETLAQELTTRVDDEVLQDEVLSLRAFALQQMGRIGDALSCLESAMEGSYTEALLINTGNVAAEADATLATKYFTRLIAEAPTEELQIEAMRFAVQIWMRTPDLVLPPETSDCLHSLLGAELDPSTYLDFIKVAARFDAARLATHPPRKPSHPGSADVFALFTAKSRLKSGTSDLSQFARDVIAVSRSARNEQWFDSEVDDFTKHLGGELLENDFGKAPHAALAMELIFREMPSLLSRAQYFMLGPQAGAHLAAFASETGGLLDSAMRNLLLFVPVEEFRVERKDLPEGLTTVLESNFALCLHVFLSSQWSAAGEQKDQIASEFNTVNQRRQWDTQNAYQLTRRLHGILDRLQSIIDELRRAQERCRLFPGEERQQELLRVATDDIENWQREVIRLKAGL